MRYVLALDQGTTSSRALLFDEQAQRVAVAQQPFTQHFPKPGWVEHDPMEILSTQLTVAREAISGIHPSEVAAIGITNQRETTILWDRATGLPIAPAIVWQDRRTADHCARLRVQGLADEVTGLTGLVVDPYFSATKIAWLLDHVDGARERAERGELAFGTVDTWLTWHLTGGHHVTDVTNAGRTMLADLRTGKWSERLLEIFGIPRAVLPEIMPTSGIVGATTLFGGLTPIAALAGDQHAATFGQGCWEPGTAKNTYGTGCFLLMNTGAEPVTSTNRLLTTPAWRLGSEPTQYALEGSVFVAGAAVQWVRDTLGILDDAEASEALAASVPDSGGVTFVPAFTGLGAPYWDAEARGMMIGITRGTTAGHLTRATLDAIALQTADLVEALNADSETPLQELRVDGGGSRNNLLMQIQADLLGVPVLRPVETETTALGVAHLAGLAVGMWDRETLNSTRALDRGFDPTISADERAARRQEWRRAVERCRGWA